MSILHQKVTGKILGSLIKTKKGGYICNLLLNAESKNPEVLKVHSNDAGKFSNVDPQGNLTLNVQLQDFCFAD